MSQCPHYIAIEGCIGVGKTTLTRILAEAFGARTVLEVVEENPFLPDFYRDAKAHAFKTQVFFLLSRFKQQLSLAQGDLFDSYTVADYMFAKDRIFAELTLSDAELALYIDMFHALDARVPRPDLVICLQAPLPVILERIRRRGRSFERDIDPDYLRALLASYRRFFSHYDETPLLVVDTADLNFPSCERDVELILEVVRGGVEGARHLDATGLCEASAALLFPETQSA